ncbi:uncharacterized protein [Littorina saxatilis]|uniref:uncharacterized protein isoform X2 n=1 Tax=Littorina saxatilis TaxID=31220 RepID=UPI0038B61C84
MSKVANRTPAKPENKGSGDHRRESSGGRNDRGDKSHSHSRSESNSRNKHADHANNSKDDHDGEKNSEQKSTEEKKFTGRCRLFVGNLTPDVTEDDFKKMFEPYGEVSETYVNTSRGFGFIRLDYRHNAEAAKAALDGLQRKGRQLRVRFATHGAALKVKNLHPFVSNECLEQAFSQFGELERAIVIVDDRGKPTGEGLVEFVRKPGAQQALRRINEGVFLFGVDPKPIEVEVLEQKDEEDGMPEKFLSKNDQYKKEREKEPHFAPHGSFEYEFGMRWKQLDDMEKKRIENVKKEMEEARIKLEDEMQNALYDYQAEQIRQDLLRQQEELRRIEELRNQDRMRRQQELEIRMSSRRAEEDRARAQDERRREMMIRQQEMQQRRSGGGVGPMEPAMQGRSREEMMAGGMRGGPEGPGGYPGGQSGMGMRGGQGQGQGGMESQMRGGRGGAPPMQPPPAPPAGMGLERGAQPGMGRMQQGGGGGQGGQAGFGGQGGLPANVAGGAGIPSGGGSPNINNMGGQGGPGGAGNQMDMDSWTSHYVDHQPLPSHSDSPCSGPSQFEDADEDPMSEERRFQGNGSWLPPPGDNQQGHFVNGDVDETKQSVASGQMEFRDGTSREQNEFVDADNRSNWEESAFVDGAYGSVSSGDWYDQSQAVGEDVYGRTNVHDPSSVADISQGEWTEGQDHVNGDLAGDTHFSPTHEVHSETLSKHNAAQEAFYSEAQNLHGTTQNVSFGELNSAHNSSQEMSFGEEQDHLDLERGPCEVDGTTINDGSSAEVDVPHPEPDNSMALVPYLTPEHSPCPHSPCPSPPVSPPLRQGPSVAAFMAAAGVPLHHNPLNMGGPRLVRVHPMHVAAAVAAQRNQAAAGLMMQRQRAAAAAVLQQQAARQQAAAAAVQQQAAAAAVQQQAARQQAAAAAVQQQAAQRQAAQRQAATALHQQAAQHQAAQQQAATVLQQQAAQHQAATALHQQAAQRQAAQQQAATALQQQASQRQAAQQLAARALQQRAAQRQAQQSAAAGVQQHTAAGQQHATQQQQPMTAAHQQAVAAAAQQRTQAVLMHQQLVRSRYMGAPVLVRPSFMPAAARVAAPLRVRMRVRRELNLGPP